MTKRFRVHELVKYDYSEIGEYIDENHTDRPLRNDEVVELLNELHEENDVLKQELKTKVVVNRQYEELQTLKKENEQLKKQMQRLYNYFIDWHGEIMGANQFSEMWDDVKEDEDWED